MTEFYITWQPSAKYFSYSNSLLAGPAISSYLPSIWCTQLPEGLNNNLIIAMPCSALFNASHTGPPWFESWLCLQLHFPSCFPASQRIRMGKESKILPLRERYQAEPLVNVWCLLVPRSHFCICPLTQPKLLCHHTVHFTQPCFLDLLSHYLTLWSSPPSSTCLIRHCKSQHKLDLRKGYPRVSPSSAPTLFHDPSHMNLSQHCTTAGPSPRL